VFFTLVGAAMCFPACFSLLCVAETYYRAPADYHPKLINSGR
jgi:hypothetical protein